ncbi:uncharacterized protein N7515_008033 [Penicillium bovifimosum]|uniref:DJ-1/PfpI domain-containing protein n=1 Tax=Penicillium bovifimosum TaxID=126998 RepID=A0A9W9KXG1_9EURO|nr:uncharacterized protein N7515_008033 [Penicillium bovifimosum]KAJ5124208.1 hypothetical protein N7515_008033 [Penicillium bovifimosum]
MSLPLRIGVLLAGTIQLLDLASIDLLYMSTPTYLASLALPQTLVSMGRPCEIHYISTANPSNRTTTTAELSLALTDSPSDPAVSPGNLDIVIVPGPSPVSPPPTEADLDFVRRHNAANTSILSLCTGAYIIGYSGIANGRQITGPKTLIPELKQRFPGARWDDGVRVLRDGNLWSSGGIANGHDLVLWFLREHYPAELVDTIRLAVDMAERPVEYEPSLSANGTEVV